MRRDHRLIRSRFLLCTYYLKYRAIYFSENIKYVLYILSSTSYFRRNIIRLRAELWHQMARATRKSRPTIAPNRRPGVFVRSTYARILLPIGRPLGRRIFTRGVAGIVISLRARDGRSINRRTSGRSLLISIGTRTICRSPGSIVYSLYIYIHRYRSRYRNGPPPSSRAYPNVVRETK